MARVNVIRRCGGVPLTAAETRALARACAPAAWRGAVLNLVFAADAEVIALNRRYTGREGATDVLAFPLDEEAGADGERVIGDVVVNVEHARAEAAARGVPAAEETALYVVHGVLHLAGFDDHDAAERRRMYAREREALAAAGRPCVR